MNNLKNVTAKTFTEDGVEYLKLTGVQEIDNEKHTIMLNKIKLDEIEIVKTDGKATHIQLPLITEDNGSVGQVLLNQENIENKGEVNDMKKATIKINVGEPIQIGDKMEIPLLVNGKEIKKIIATIGEDDKLYVEELLKNNMEFKTNGSNVIITNEKGEANHMKLNLIPDLKFTNDRGETIKIETQEVVIRIGNSILLKHTPDISDELNNIFEGAKEVIIDLEYYTLDQNEKPTGVTTRKVYVNRYKFREYYNTKRDENDIVYLFTNDSDYELKELIEEYRHRQIVEYLKFLSMYK